MMSESLMTIEGKANIDTLLIAAEVLERNIDKSDESCIVGPAQSNNRDAYQDSNQKNHLYRSLISPGDTLTNIRNNHRRFSTLSPPTAIAYKSCSLTSGGVQSDKRRHSVIVMPNITSDLFPSSTIGQLNAEDYKHWASISQQTSPSNLPQYFSSTSSQSMSLNSFPIPDSSSWMPKIHSPSYSKSRSLNHVNEASELIVLEKNSVSSNVSNKRLRTALLADRLSLNQLHSSTSAIQSLKNRKMSDVTMSWTILSQTSPTTSVASSSKGSSLVVSSTTATSTQASLLPSPPPPVTLTSSSIEIARVPRLPAKKRKIDWSLPDDALPPGKDLRSGAKMSLPCGFEGAWGGSRAVVNGNGSHGNPSAGTLIVDRPAEPNNSPCWLWTGIHPSDRVRKRSEPVLFPSGISPFASSVAAANTIPRPPPHSSPNSSTSRSLHLLQQSCASAAAATSINQTTPLMPPPAKQQKLSYSDLSFTCDPGLHASRASNTSNRILENQYSRSPLAVDVLSERRRRRSPQRSSNHFENTRGGCNEFSPTKTSEDSSYLPPPFDYRHSFETENTEKYTSRRFSVAGDGGFSPAFLKSLSEQTANSLLAQQQEFHRRHSSVLPPQPNSLPYLNHCPPPSPKLASSIEPHFSSPYLISTSTPTSSRSLLISRSSAADDRPPTPPSQHRSSTKAEPFHTKRPVSQPQNVSFPLTAVGERQRKHSHVPVLGAMLSSQHPSLELQQQPHHSKELVERSMQDPIQQQNQSFIEQQSKSYRKHSLDSLFTSKRRETVANLAQANCAILLTCGQSEYWSDTSHGFPLLLVSAPSAASAAAFAAATALASGAPASSLIPVPVQIADSPPSDTAAFGYQKNGESDPSTPGKYTSSLTFISTSLDDDLHPLPKLIFPILKTKGAGSSRFGGGDGPCALGLPFLVPTTSETGRSKHEALSTD